MIPFFVCPYCKKKGIALFQKLPKSGKKVCFGKDRKREITVIIVVIATIGLLVHQ
jgi:hypothetical protein